MKKENKKKMLIRIKDTKEKLKIVSRDNRITIVKNSKDQVFKIPNIYLDEPF